MVNPFSDVKPGDAAYEDVDKLVRAGIMEGFPDGTFKGRKVVNRYEMAKIVARLLANVQKIRDAGGRISPEEILAVTRLTNEFRTELDLLGVRVESVEKRVDKVERKTATLEAALSNVRIEGFYRLENTFVFRPFNSFKHPQQFNFANYPFDITKNPFTIFVDPGLQPLAQEAFLRFIGSPFLAGSLFKNVEAFVELHARIVGPTLGNAQLNYRFSNPPIAGDNLDDFATDISDFQRVEVSKAHFKTFAKLATFRAFANESMQDLTDPAVLLTADAFDVPPFSGVEVNGSIMKMSYFASALKVQALKPSPFPNGNNPLDLTEFFTPLSTTNNDIFSLRLTYQPYRYRRGLKGQGPTTLTFGTTFVEKVFSYDQRNNFNRVIATDLTLAHQGKDEKFDLTIEPEFSFGVDPTFLNGGDNEQGLFDTQDISGQAFRLDTNYTYKGFLANFKAYTFSRFFRANAGARQFIDYNLPPYRDNFGRRNDPTDQFSPAESLARLNLKFDLGHKIFTHIKNMSLSLLGEAKTFSESPNTPRLDDDVVASRWFIQTIIDLNDRTHIEAIHEQQYPIPPIPLVLPAPLDPQKAVQDSKLSVDFKATKKTSFVGELEFIDDGNRSAIDPAGRNYSYERARFQINSQTNRHLFLSGYVEQTDNALQRRFADANGNIIRPLSFNARRVVRPSRNGLDLRLIGLESNLQMFNNKVGLKNYLLRETAADEFDPTFDGTTDVYVTELLFQFTRALRARYQFAYNDQHLENRQSIFFMNHFGELLYNPSEKTEIKLTYGYEYENPDDRFDNGPYLFYKTIRIVQLKAQTDF